MNRLSLAVLVFTAWMTGATTASPALGQDSWPRFDDRYPPWGTKPRPERREAPAPGRDERAEPYPAQPSTMAPLLAPVERSELPPAVVNDGSGLPFDLWTGIDLQTAEQLIAGLQLPPPSPALMELWRRLMTASTSQPSGAAAAQFTALRAEGLYRSGQMKQLGELLNSAAARGSDPLLTAFSARYSIAVGQRDSGCSAVKEAAARKQDLPPSLAGEMLVLAGYCAAAAGNVSAASLAADLAREEGINNAALLDALLAVGAGRKPRLPRNGQITPAHYRLLQLADAVDPTGITERADAALLGSLVLGPGTNNELRVAAAEAAARLNIIAPEEVADIYRAQRFAPPDLANPLASRPNSLLRRALLFQAAEAERDPARRAEILRAFLDEARRAGFYMPALAMAAPLIKSVPRSPDFAWFAETAIEAALAAGDHPSVRAWWVSLDAHSRGSSRLEHWLALSDIANAEFDAPRGLHLPAVETLALRGAFSGPVLHRLATVLDALDYQVPMELWHLASSTPQPNEGHLPETGVLTQLKEASSRGEFARTVLLVMRTVGPKGPEGAHIIALGDAIRALRRVGLEADARRLAFEALFNVWPRSASR